MKKPFVTACGTIANRNLLIIRLFADGIVGLGECSANVDPIYSPETIKGCMHIIEDFILPSLMGKKIDDLSEVAAAMSHVVGNHMAKSAVELAFWDIMSRQKGVPISSLLGGTKTRVDAGVSVGMSNTIEETIDEARLQLAKGFARLKVKIQPGHDVQLISSLRDHLGDIQLMADANSSYSLKQAGMLQALDPYRLTQIEQPLENDDIVDHAALQKILRTPICLDESVVHARAARQAIDLDACRIINVKLARVSGLLEAKKIHDLCAKTGTGLWCGSMLESGVGMMYNIIYSSLPGVNQPGDIQESCHYMSDDIVEPMIDVARDGTFAVPAEPGIGVSLNWEKMRRYLVSSEVFRPCG
jgi:O-succinylbenzoate synthase